MRHRILCGMIICLLFSLFLCLAPAAADGAEELLAFEETFQFPSGSSWQPYKYAITIRCQCDLTIVVGSTEESSQRHIAVDSSSGLYLGDDRIESLGWNKLYPGQRITQTFRNVQPGKYTFYVLFFEDAMQYSTDVNYVYGSVTASNQAAVLSDSTLEVGLDEKHTIKAYVPSGVKVSKWASSNNKIVKVDKKGKITAVSFGKAKITAKLSNKRKLVCSVTVRPVMDKTEISLAYGEKNTLKLKKAGKKPKITWTSSNTEVATVAADGKVTAGNKTGTAKITATVGKGSASCTVKVMAPLTIEVDKISNGTIWLYFYNNSNKKITYVDFTIKQYNNIGTELPSPCEHALNEDLEAHGKKYRSGSVNSGTRKVKIIINKVYFADGSVWKP